MTTKSWMGADMSKNMKGYRKGKIHFGVNGESRYCVAWQQGEEYPNIESTLDWSKVTCKRCLAMR